MWVGWWLGGGFPDGFGGLFVLLGVWCFGVGCGWATSGGLFG